MTKLLGRVSNLLCYGMIAFGLSLPILGNRNLKKTEDFVCQPENISKIESILEQELKFYDTLSDDKSFGEEAVVSETIDNFNLKYKDTLESFLQIEEYDNPAIYEKGSINSVLNPNFLFGLAFAGLFGFCMSYGSMRKDPEDGSLLNPSLVYLPSMACVGAFGLIYISSPPNMYVDLTNQVSIGYHEGFVETPQELTSALLHESVHYLQDIYGGPSGFLKEGHAVGVSAAVEKEVYSKNPGLTNPHLSITFALSALNSTYFNICRDSNPALRIDLDRPNLITVGYEYSIGYTYFKLLEKEHGPQIYSDVLQGKVDF